jgi:hypothetical protein
MSFNQHKLMSVKNGESETDSNIGEFLFSQAKYDTIA